MLDVMILYVIYEYELSMYLILKKIHEVFGNFSKPSFGAIKPALVKLENAGLIKMRKAFSDGGRPTCYYSVTADGKKALKTLLLKDLSKNPVQFKPNASVKIIASEVLSKDEQQNVLTKLSRQTELLKIECEKKLQKNQKFFQKVLIDNLILEYDNYLKLIERLGK